LTYGCRELREHVVISAEIRNYGFVQLQTRTIYALVTDVACVK